MSEDWEADFIRAIGIAVERPKPYVHEGIVFYKLLFDFIGLHFWENHLKGAMMSHDLVMFGPSNLEIRHEKNRYFEIL